MMMDMTVGKPAKLMMSFAVPMLVGNIFQQLYNVVDTIIVGRFVGREALAAVGSSFAIIVLINSIILGLAMGASVLFSQLYGAKDYKRLKTSIIMAAVFILAVTLVLSVITFFSTDTIIRLYKMPPETVHYASGYLRCIFAGLIFVSLYNIAANVLRSLGDSKTPLYFLLIACFINIVLDLWFVVGMGMEVFGAAVATVIAQAVSGIACAGFTVYKIKFLQFHRSDAVFDRALFRTMGKYAFLTSVQQSVMNFGIVMIQGLVNTFGSALMAAFSAGVKIDAFAYMPVQDFGNAFSTYTAQNVGAGNKQRVRQGLKTAAVMTGIFSIIVTIVVILFAKPLVGLFVKAEDVEVIAIGVKYLHIEGAFYILIGFLFMFYGFYRGLGLASMSIVLTVVSLGTRVLLAYMLAPSFGYTMIFWAIPIGWLLADLVGVVTWLRVKKLN